MALKHNDDFRERPHHSTRYEVVYWNGITSDAKFGSAIEAAEFAKHVFPDQEQDEERSGKGWDIQVVGADRG